jgi:ABC-type uncharacterized transport system substrate-binding protein
VIPCLHGWKKEYQLLKKTKIKNEFVTLNILPIIKILQFMRTKLKTLLRSTALIGMMIIVLLTMNQCVLKSQKEKMKLSLIQYNDSPLSELSREGIVEGLKLAGLKKDTDYVLNISNAQGDIGVLNLIFDGVLNAKPRLVFVTSTPTLQVALKKITEIPVVFSVVADPVLAGAGKSFEDHRPNVTGISTLGDYEGMIGLIKKIRPETKKIGTLYTPGETNSVRNMNFFKHYAELAGIELIVVPVNSSSDVIDATLSLIAMQPEIVCQIVDNLTSLSVSGIIKTCQEHQIPMFGFVSDQAEKGAVLVVSRDYRQAGIDAARLAGKIIQGMNPGEIPFEYVSRTEILINQAAASIYNITIPEDIIKLENTIIIK